MRRYVALAVQEPRRDIFLWQCGKMSQRHNAARAEAGRTHGENAAVKSQCRDGAAQYHTSATIRTQSGHDLALQKSLSPWGVAIAGRVLRGPVNTV